MFDPSVKLPAGLEISAIRRAIEYIERALNDRDFIDLYYEQANVFSAIVGMFGTKALDSLSNYEKHRHSTTAQTRFPDLSRRGAPTPLRPEDCLESKASLRGWPIQSHYDHSGWYIVWRYLVDPTKTIKPDLQLVIWRVDVVFLNSDDWKYEGSGAGVSGGGRTHTFGVIRPAAKLRECAVYHHPGIRLRGGKPVPVNTVNGDS